MGHLSQANMEAAMIFVFMAAAGMHARFVFPSLIAAWFVLARPEYFFHLGAGISTFGYIFMLFWMVSLLITFMRS